MSSLKITPNEIRKIKSQYILFPTVSLSYNNTVSAQTLLQVRSSNLAPYCTHTETLYPTVVSNKCLHDMILL